MCRILATEASIRGGNALIYSLLRRRNRKGNCASCTKLSSKLSLLWLSLNFFRENTMHLTSRICVAISLNEISGHERLTNQPNTVFFLTSNSVLYVLWISSFYKETAFFQFQRLFLITLYFSYLLLVWYQLNKAVWNRTLVWNKVSNIVSCGKKKKIGQCFECTGHKCPCMKSPSNPSPTPSWLPVSTTVLWCPVNANALCPDRKTFQLDCI